MAARFGYRRLVSGPAVFIALAVVVTACSGGSSGSSSRVHQVLDHIPASELDEFGPVIATDLVLGAERAGLDRPSCGDGDQKFAEHLGSLATAETTFVRAPLAFGQAVLQSDDIETGLGFRPCNVEATASLGPFLEVYAIDRSEGDVRGAIESDPEWSSELEVRSVEGATVFEWDADEPDFTRDSFSHPGGFGGVASFSDGVFARTIGREIVVGLPVTESVADLPAVASALEHVDGAHSVGLFARPRTSDVLPSERLAGATLLIPYGPVLVAETQRDDAIVVVAVMSHATNEDAIANRDRFEQIVESGSSVVREVPWSTWLTLSSIEVDGTEVVVQLTPVDDAPVFRIAYESLIVQDTLFAAS